MKRIVLVFIITGISLNLFSQTSGYIRKDSSYLSGYLKVQSGEKAFTSCKYSTTKTGDVVNYSPDQVYAYGYSEVNYFSLPVKTGDSVLRRFLMAIVQGDNPVYFLKNKSGRHFYILDEKKATVELIKSKGEFKTQLARYLEAPASEIPTIHTFFCKAGIKSTIKILKYARATNAAIESESLHKSKLWLKRKPGVEVSLLSGITHQQLPLHLNAGLPSNWDKLKASSYTYSLSVDIPIIKNWPVTYHQEICFNKFVTNYKQGNQPPDYQLIQNSSEISLPVMLRYTLGRKNFTVFINSGFQLDFGLNNSNVEWLKLTTNESNTGVIATSGCLDYKSIRSGITEGFGISYKFTKNLALISEFRHSSVFKLQPEKAGAEKQSVLKVGISYNFYKKGITL